MRDGPLPLVRVASNIALNFYRALKESQLGGFPVPMTAFNSILGTDSFAKKFIELLLL